MLPIPGLPHAVDTSTPHPGIRGTGTRAPSHWCIMMIIVKLDRCERVQVHHAQSHSSSTRTGTTKTPTTRRTRERAKDHSMKHCEQNVSRWIKIGKPIGRFRLPLHYHTTMVATRTPRHSMARSRLVERVMATDSLQILCGGHFARLLRIRRFFSQMSRTDISECRARDGV